MRQPTDIVHASLPEPESLVMDGVDQTEKGIVLQVRSKGTPRCPACSGSDVAYHSTYLRHLRDLPWQGQRVEIQVKTRRFRCRNRQCRRQIFAERLPGVATQGGARNRSADAKSEVSRLPFGGAAGIASAGATGDES